jgi:tRNA synthetases class II (D, K and N)
MIESEIVFADLSDNAALAGALLKYTFAALLKEGEEDLAFFDPRNEKGLVAKLKGIVGSEFVRMDYGEAIEVLERANDKFEFPVKWGIDLQSEHERYLTEKHAKKPVIVMNYPKAIKAFYMQVNDDGRTVAPPQPSPLAGEGWVGLHCRLDRRDHRRAASAKSGSIETFGGVPRVKRVAVSCVRQVQQFDHGVG